MMAANSAPAAPTYGAVVHEVAVDVPVTAENSARGSSTRKALAASTLVLVLVALVAGVSSWSKSGHAAQEPLSASATRDSIAASASSTVTALAAESSDLIEIVHFNEYTANMTDPYEFLPWKNIAEPHKATTFQLSDASLSAMGCADAASGCSVAWVLGSTSYADTQPVHKFTSTGYQHVGVKVTNADGRTVAASSDSVMVKYVRREVRSLSEADREMFLAALHTVYTVDTVAGQGEFGADYLGIEYFVRKHLYGAASKECDHWHDDAGIMTHHVGFTMEFERNLQRVAPATSIPYWEYTYDEYAYCQPSDTGASTTCWPHHIAKHSQLFKETWFGEAIPASDDHSITSGRWAGLAVLQNARNFSTVTNPYGLLRSPWNTDPTPKVMRFNTVLGESWEAMVGCERWDACFRSDTLAQMNNCLNGGTHGPVHILLGGQWANNHSILLAKDSIFHGISGPHLILAKHLWRFGYLQCPDVCSSDTPESHCTCSCPDKAKQGASAYEVLATKTPLMHWLAAHTRGAISYAADEDRYHVQGYTKQMEDDAWDELLDAMCDPGHAGEMYTSAAPYDPMFWMIHPTAERMLSWRRLLGDFGWKPFNETWGYAHTDDTSDLGQVCHWSDGADMPTCEVGTCSGHGEDDLLPFEGLIVEGERPSNGELLAFIHPSNPDLPYAYDTFSYPQCSAQKIAIGWDTVPSSFKRR